MSTRTIYDGNLAGNGSRFLCDGAMAFLEKAANPKYLLRLQREHPYRRVSARKVRSAWARALAGRQRLVRGPEITAHNAGGFEWWKFQERKGTPLVVWADGRRVRLIEQATPFERVTVRVRKKPGQVLVFWRGKMPVAILCELRSVPPFCKE